MTKIRHIDVFRIDISTIKIDSRLIDALGTHRNRPLSRQSSPFLPADEMATVVPGKVNAVVGHNEFPVRSLIITFLTGRRIAPPATDPRSKVIRNLAPGHIHRILQLYALARM